MATTILAFVDTSFRARPWRNVICQVALLMGFCSASHAVDTVSLELGTGNKTDVVRLGLQWEWDRQWRKRNGTHIGGYWDLNLAQWRGTRFQNQPGNVQRFMAVGVTPVFRWQNNDLRGLYGEAGVGLRHLFELYDNNGRQLSTNFQFASHLGAGYVFRNDVDLGLRIQHFSNGSIKKPNGGVNFIVVRVAYRF
jgi:lipid A 3-O-deacylase